MHIHDESRGGAASLGRSLLLTMEDSSGAAFARRRRASLDASLLTAPSPALPPEDEADTPASLPVSWLFFQQTFWFPQFLGCGSRATRTRSTRGRDD